MTEYLPLYDDQNLAITRTASTDIQGGRLVAVSGPGTVRQCTGDDAGWLGIAAFDVKSGDLVTVFSGNVQRPIALGNINPGDEVVGAANGQVARSTAGGPGVVGIAISAGVAGQPVEVRFAR